MACGEHKHPLQRGGSSQADRFLAGLEPGYAQVDEKDLADWIVYAEELSASVKFFNLENQAPPGSNWKPFFSSDISASLAFVAVQNKDGLGGIAARFTTLRADANQGDPGLLKQTLGELFGAALTFAKSLDDLVARLPAGSPLRLVTHNLIRTKLAKTIERLIAYFKAAQADLLVAGGSVPSWKILGRPVTDAQSIIDGTLSEAWIPGGGAWSTHVAGIAADASIYGDPLALEAQKIRHAANHNLFAALFDQLLGAYARVLAEAAKNLAATLGDWKEHPPHYTLFLAFLQLLKRVQEKLNQFTTRHLNYYYRDILRLQPRTPAPDSAFITIELARMVSNHLLPSGTLFRAGKDTAGQDVFYSLQKDVVFNKGKVARLMSVYRGSAKDNIGPVVHADRWFAAPISNSADGNGAELTAAQKEWHPYVNRTYVDGELESINQPLAQIGFAIASHYLALAEGRREISIRLATSANSSLTSVSFELFLTGAKGWVQAPAPVLSTATIAGTSYAILKIELEPTAPAVVDYDPAIHGGTFGVKLPVIKIILRNDPEQAYSYEGLRDIELTKVEVEVDVGSTASASFTAEGVKQLFLASGAGPLDPAKPFLPFGPQPETGAAFVIGSREIFSKKGAQLRFNFEWLNPPGESDIAYADSTPPEVEVEFLEGGVWTSHSDESDLFGTNSAVAFPSSLISVPDDVIVPYDEPFDLYSNQTRAGHLRLRLDDTFGHKEYLADLTAYLIEQSKPDPDPDITKPAEPYQPTLQSFLISYKASPHLDLADASATAVADRAIRFFHAYPFGEAEQPGQPEAGEPVYLMPQFRHVETPLDTGAGGGAETSVELENQAEFYVGLESLSGGESISLLFQFMDGSSDPQTLKPDEHLYFSYLSNNAWKAIRRNLVTDGTRQFIQSGLVELAIPKDATTTNTLLPAGYIWLRFSVAEAPDAIAKIIAVLPQAALVTYQPTPLNAPDFPAAPLPAGTIAKLKEPVSAIKKIQQPYPSFRLGGSGETERLFHARVSERLRHKDRAISIWDYEHLVLQAFPQIHRVKCLSHTSLVPDPAHPGDLLCNELAPGKVLVITIPNLANRNDANPLRPYTNADLIAEIQEFLRARVSCHAEVAVANPLFEELRMEFTVTLRKGYTDAAFYRTQLQEEITRFLTPWAFEEGQDIDFGGKVHKSSLIDFIEERDAVDFLTDVKLYHKAGDNAVESEDLDEISASTARSILVSAPASKHAITVLLHDEAPALEEECCTDE